MAVKKKISIKNIGLVSTKLKQKAEAAKSSEGPVNEEVKDHGKVVKFYVEHEDGTALLAEGEHADVIYRFTHEAQILCVLHSLSSYQGPPMTKMTKEEALKKIIGVSNE